MTIHVKIFNMMLANMTLKSVRIIHHGQLRYIPDHKLKKNPPEPGSGGACL